MNGQIELQAKQISHLVCSLAGPRVSQYQSPEGKRSGEREKEAADIPPSKVENDLCTTGQILALFRGQHWGDC